MTKQQIKQRIWKRRGEKSRKRADRARRLRHADEHLAIAAIQRRREKLTENLQKYDVIKKAVGMGGEGDLRRRVRKATGSWVRSARAQRRTP